MLRSGCGDQLEFLDAGLTRLDLREVPQETGTVATSRCKHLPIWGDRQGPDRGGVAEQLRPLDSGGGVPQSAKWPGFSNIRLCIGGGGCDEHARRREADRAASER